MEELNVKDILGEYDSQRVFRSRKWDSDEAYSRLKMVRDNRNTLIAQLEERSKMPMPIDCKTIYEKIVYLYDELEILEQKNIKFGE